MAGLHPNGYSEGLPLRFFSPGREGSWEGGKRETIGSGMGEKGGKAAKGNWVKGKGSAGGKGGAKGKGTDPNHVATPSSSDLLCTCCGDQNHK